LWIFPGKFLDVALKTIWREEMKVIMEVKQKRRTKNPMSLYGHMRDVSGQVTIEEESEAYGVECPRGTRRLQAACPVAGHP
jgi:hypothetical protein